ncbi:MAG: NAD(P)-binding domain-containing protein, partial [Dehalococcoidia bacterium]
MHQANQGSNTTSTAASDLQKKIAERAAKVGVLGLGYVGLPTLVGFAGAGFKVTGLDIDQAKVNQINSGQSYIEDVASETLASLVNQHKVRATTEMSVLEDLDVIMICVPTP